eukprot:Gb_37468 [translate_table: standard]
MFMQRFRVIMSWNVFKLCTALRSLGSIMILVVLGIVGVTYYAVVIANYGPSLLKKGWEAAGAFSILICFHGLLGLLLWSYFAVVLTDPGGVPPNWTHTVDEESGDTVPLTSHVSDGPGLSLHQLTGMSASSNPRVRYCRKCGQFKPPRCHHCCVCGRCVLKMDHHCVWVVNCVGARNYKFFLLFLFYTFLETILVTLVLLPCFMNFYSQEEILGTSETLATTFFGFVLNLAFSLSVLGFLVMHISLVASNTTTIEASEKKTSPKWRYDLGQRKNFEQVFGTHKLFWLIPAYAEEDLRRMPVLQGLQYPSKPDLDTQEL